MKCELCNTNEAEVAIKQAADGQVRELFVCTGCAKRSGEKTTNPVVELLFGAAFALGSERAPDTTCAGCGLSRSEFRKRSRLGCERCYASFARDIGPMLRDMHRGERHVGKVPRQERLATTLVRLQEALDQAVAAQRYEEAARLRDELRALREGQGPLATGGVHAPP